MSLSTPSSRLLRTGTCIPRKAFGRYEFLVCDVSLMKKEPTEKITSQTFVMSDSSEWVLDIYLGGKTERQAGFVTTEVILLKVGEVDDDSVAATINLSLLCQSGTHVNDPLDGSTSYTSLPATTFGTDSETHSTWALDNFIQTSALAQKYIHNDSLLFALDIEITGKPVTLRSAMRAYVGPISTLQLDLASLLNDTETSFSDIVIVVEGQKFYCHKCILAARSTLFNRKFLNPAFKAKQLFNRGEYHMSGINSNIFQCLLRFIYTDECR